MVKVYGPMMSLDASGTLADAITHAKWKGRNYVRARTTPANPKSGAQVGRRQMFRFLTTEWGALPDATKAQWQDQADELVASPFNAYVAYNQERWHNFLSPSHYHPLTPGGTLGVWEDTPQADWIEHRIEFQALLSAVNDNWGAAVFASPTPGFDTAVANAILIEPIQTLQTHYWYWTPPTVATWYFDVRLFTTRGDLGAEAGEFNSGPP